MKNKTIIDIEPLGFQWKTSDPFLFCIHHEDFYPKGNEELGPAVSISGRNIGQDFTPKDGWRMYHGSKIPGFPVHPHRGFETITIVQKGYVDHFDSLGATGRFSVGDVQWMTAGKGIQHSEMFPLLNKEKENTLELFQIWLNLPSSKKFVEPQYTMFWQEKIPHHIIQDKEGKNTYIDIISGKYENINPLPPPHNSWAADPNNFVVIWKIEMESYAKWILPATKKGVNRNLYFYKGSDLRILEQNIRPYQRIELNPEEQVVLENGQTQSHLLLLEGKPISEDIVQYGPFVMNSNYEIQMAFTDYQKTQFGGWPWNSIEPVHAPNMGRFAKYTNGDEDIK